MRIVFMGTPEYSVETLKALNNENFEIAAVFAQPDKPVGRKQILTPPPTKVYAKEHDIPVFQPESVRDGETLQILKQLNPDVIVVVAYGKILPKEILDLPKFGCVNGHASLLPKLRGASPIQWAIVSGETETGVTTMLMDEGMDTGDILLSESVKIGSEETADRLFERLSVVSAGLMLKTLNALKNNEIKPIKQNNSDATYTPIIKKEMAHIDFKKSAKDVYNAIKGFFSWPCAYFLIDNKRYKIISANLGVKTNLAAGTVFKESDGLFIACGDGNSVRLLVVGPEGKKAMKIEDLLRGNSEIVGKIAE